MKDTTRIFYLRDETGFPIATVATDLLLGSGEQPVGVAYGVAVWNPKDKFDKALSRNIALGRLLLNGTYVHVRANFKSAVMEDIVNVSTLPSKAKRAAQRWLDAKVMD